jgi:hypothetical protein
MFDIATRQVDIVLPLETEVTPVIEAGGESVKARTTMTGVLVAMLFVLVAAQAHAKAASVCVQKKNNSVDHKGTDGSECFASSDGSGKARSSATGDKSFADAEVNSGGKAKATATGGSFSEALTDTGSKSTSNASNGSSVTATSDEHGVAKGTANGSMSEADPSAFGKCNASATATNTGSLATLATANCGSNGTFARATATNGGTAKAFDNASPTCTATGTETAQVTSSGGNCTAP